MIEISKAQQLMTSIIKEFTGKDFIENKSLEELAVNKKKLLSFIDERKEKPYLTLEVRFGLDDDQPMSPSFIKNPKDIVTYQDLISSCSSVMYC
jgi:hypothetical protein